MVLSAPTKSDLKEPIGHATRKKLRNGKWLRYFPPELVNDGFFQLASAYVPDCRIIAVQKLCSTRQGPYVGIEMKRCRSQTADSSVGVKELLHHCVVLISDETKEVLAALF